MRVRNLTAWEVAREPGQTWSGCDPTWRLRYSVDHCHVLGSDWSGLDLGGMTLVNLYYRQPSLQSHQAFNAHVPLGGVWSNRGRHVPGSWQESFWTIGSLSICVVGAAYIQLVAGSVHFYTTLRENTDRLSASRAVSLPSVSLLFARLLLS